MSMISTVSLPVVALTTTIGQAFARLSKEGVSGLVVRDDRGPVVVTDQALRNTLIMASGNDETPMSAVVSRAFDAQPTRRLLRSTASRSLLASAQDHYVVSDINDQAATVITDAQHAAELKQPFVFSSLPSIASP